MRLLSQISLCGALFFFIAGCGGGGGGNSGPSTPTATPTPTTPPVANQLFFDDFGGGSLSGNWGNYGSQNQLQRTRFGIRPDVLSENGTSFVRLRLESFNAAFPGNFRGTEIFTNRRFARGDGLEVSTRLRGPNLPPGIIFAFFTIYDRFNGTPSDSTYLKDEIDFEFLTAQEEQFTPRNQRNKLYLNVWDRWNLRFGFDGNDVDDGSATESNLRSDKTYQRANYDYANWNVYTIRWLPDRTEFLLNGNLERTEREVRPAEPMSVHFNIWTGTPDFDQAYSASLQPDTGANTNRTFAFDVDYVRVRQLGNGATTFNLAPEKPLPSSFKSYRNR
ncbi:MAG TPA: glycoside hydrolase family 16 protein [Abditibacterium sp.]|jgi:hypothetical protein